MYVPWEHNFEWEFPVPLFFFLESHFIPWEHVFPRNVILMTNSPGTCISQEIPIQMNKYLLFLKNNLINTVHLYIYFSCNNNTIVVIVLK